MTRGCAEVMFLTTAAMLIILAAIFVWLVWGVR